MSKVHSVVAFLFVHMCLVSGQTSDDDVCIPHKLRIVGGQDTTIKKHPWQISLQKHNRFHCGGSIISSDFILTAAHCIDKAYIYDGAYTVVAGVTDLKRARKQLEIKSIIVHAKYKRPPPDYDIAVVQLKEKLRFSKKINAIKLPPSSFKVPAGTILTATGWGTTEPREKSNILNEVQVPYIDRVSCQEKLRTRIPESMLCAAELKGGKDTCKGDSGGPLQLKGTLIGITSWGRGCARKIPSVYVNVMFFRSWIKGKTGI